MNVSFQPLFKDNVLIDSLIISCEIQLSLIAEILKSAS